MQQFETIISEAKRTQCLHCGQILAKARVQSDFCCVGCHAVYALIHEEGLDQFYTLKPKKFLPLINYFTRKTDWSWLENLQGIAEGHVVFKIEGLQCAGCLWLLSEIAKKMGPSQILINPSTGRADITFDANRFDFVGYLKKLELLGYTACPLESTSSEPSRDLLMRLGICMAIAMNTMFFSFSIYAGLTDTADPVYRIFSKLNFYLSFVSVAIGGSYFFGKALTALKHRVIHFDVPIAIGIMASFIGSSIAHARGNESGSFFDTINIFIALMLLGRYVQVRFLERNQKGMAKVDPFSGFSVTVIDKTSVEKKFADVKKGDRLLIQSGSIFPVEALLLSDFSIECSLASMTGEAIPRVFYKNDIIPAGAQLITSKAVFVSCQNDYQKQALDNYVPTSEDVLTPYLWRWVTRWYVVSVLTVAALGFTYWMLVDSSKALNVLVSVMVVTCPCALGIAIPLARHLGNRQLVSYGVFAKNPEFIDKLFGIKRIFCDKTGTLTLGSLTLVNPQSIEALGYEQKTILFNMVCRSRHPVSLAIYRSLISSELPVVTIDVQEKSGEGLFCAEGGSSYYLGKRADGGVGVSFMKDEIVLANIELEEEVLQDAKEVLGFVKKNNLSFYLLSGDKKENVERLACEIGVDADKVYSELVPFEKAAFVSEVGLHGDTLMIGDGLNDGLAMQAATLSGGPVWEKWGIARNADFFFISNTLSWLPGAYLISKQLKKVLRNNLAFAVLYNVGAVGFALTGVVSPLVCAVIMPASSIVVLAYTALGMRRAG